MQTSIKSLKSETGKAVTMANELVVETKDQNISASEMLSQVKQVSKRAEEEKNKVLKPLNEAVKAERERWKPLETDLIQAESIIKGKMLTFHRIEREREERERAKLQAQIDAGRIKKAETIQKREQQITQVERVTKTDIGASQIKKIKVVNVTDETKVPREYLVIDMVRVRKAALAGVVIPGVQVTEEETIAAF